LGIARRFACGWIFLKVGFRLRSLGFAFSYDPTGRTTPRQVNRVTCREPQGRAISINYLTCPAKHHERNSTHPAKDQERSRIIRTGRGALIKDDEGVGRRAVG